MDNSVIRYKKSHYFYVLYCKDHTFYGGYTTEPKRRLDIHNQGMGAKYTKPRWRRPLTMIYLEEWPTKQSAMRAEYRFKQLTRPKKEVYLKQQGVKNWQIKQPVYIDKTQLLNE